MKTIAKRIMAMILVVLMFSISPLCDAAPRSHAAGEGETYISEVKVGMGETDAEAKKELEAEGFTILKDDSGNYADLNKDAGTGNAAKEGANDKIVYLGYKTTDNVYDAITDLAVMNMNGGYSIEDYNALMDQQMNTQIKPFVESFIATLEEYRQNYKKPKSSPNHIRADYMRRLMNKLTDDDTGGQPMGDLLLNKTKFELGDAAYNALSDSEKKKHCDILTLLMQANGQATMSLKKLISRASDTSDDTWLERFEYTTLDDLIEEIEEEDSSLTSRTEIMDALDRKYGDKVETLLGKWTKFQEQATEYEYKAEELQDTSEEMAEAVEKIGEVPIEDMTEDDFEYEKDVQVDAASHAFDSQTVAICTYLESVEYDGSSMLEFFCRDYEEVSTDEGRRSLYPIIASLSAGQDAGLEFLSIMELFSMALSDEDSYKQMESSTKDTKPASVYEGVNREIYEKGAVALTSDALRAKALSEEQEPQDYKMGTLPLVFWGVTIGSAVATVASGVVSKVLYNYSHMVGDPLKVTLETNKTMIESLTKDLNKAVESLSKYQMQFYGDNLNRSQEMFLNSFKNRITNASNEIANLQNNSAITEGSLNSARKINQASFFSKYLSVGMAVITVIMTIVSVVLTVEEAKKYYRVDYLPIPKYIVEKADITATNAKGQEVMIQNQTAYYKVVKCNRTAGNDDITKKNFEAMGDANDLNGDIGREWYSLYSVKYENGFPILANSLKYQINETTVPDGYSTGIHEFGAQPACDLNKRKLLFNDKAPQIKVFFKRDTSVSKAGAAGSLFTPGSLAIGGGAGLIIGALFGGLVASRRKKKVGLAE